MIQTNHTLDIAVNDTVYTVTVRELKPSEKQILETMVEPYEKQNEVVKTAFAEVEASKREFAINKELIEASDLTQKVALLFENKGLNRAIVKQTKICEDAIKTLEKLEPSVEKAYIKRFDFMVSGEGRNDFEKVIKDLGISYHKIFESISKGIEASLEKK